MLPVPGGQALRSLSEALARRDFSALGAALPEARRSLGYAATGGNALRQEEEALLSSGAEETLVHAPRAGYFSAHGADGTMTVVSGSGWTFTAPLNEKTAARLPGGGSARASSAGRNARHRRGAHNGRRGSPFSPAARTLKAFFL